ncbi:MAG: response regulator [Bacteroidetes bacterium]|jgi:DNA-binding response OmpR family regulator|nr:response regulator [Bacteroidota bacterium]
MPDTTFPKHTVLIVDDEDVIRDLIVDVVADSGYRVLSAANGGQAVDIVRAEKGAIDMVLLDMLMPDMDGRRTYELMREIDPGIPVYIATGFGREDISKSLLEMGVRGVVTKPFHIEEILNLIKSNLRS